MTFVGFGAFRVIIYKARLKLGSSVGSMIFSMTRVKKYSINLSFSGPKCRPPD